MPAKTVSEITAYIGPAGEGKTFKMLRDYASRKSFIRCDMNHQAEMEKGARVIYNRAQMASELVSGARKICWRGVEKDPFAGFAFAARCAAAVKGEVLLLADECESMVPHTLNMNQKDPNIGYIRTVLKRGRHVHVDLVWTAQRPHEVNPTFRSNTAKFFIFKGMEPAYQKYVRDLAGADALKAMAGLAKYQCLEIIGGEYRIISKTGRALQKK